MKKNLLPLLGRRTPLSRRRAAIMSVTTVLVGIVVVISIFASGNPLAFEAESGALTGCASAVANAKASNAQAIKFSACGNALSLTDPTNLDESGATIPDSNYPIPTGAIYLATNGSDSNPGSISAPVATINQAMNLVPATGTVVVRGGIYHDGYLNSDYTYKINGKSLTIQAYPHEKAWFDGLSPVATQNWTPDGAGHWSTPWSTPQFCDNKYYLYKYNNQAPDNSGPCAHFDNYAGPEYPTATDPQLVYIDGQYVNEVASLSQATGNAFYYDWENHRTYISQNPSGHDVELSLRAHFLVSGGTAVNIKGLGFRRYATAEYEGIQSVALFISATNSTLENNTFTQNAAGAAYVHPQGGVLRHNVLAFNGYSAFGANGHAKTGGTDNILIEGNVVNNNNTEHIGTHCTASCGAAGMKIAHMNGFIARNNIFENNTIGGGFWCDEICNNGVMINNIARGNNGPGIFYEVSNNGIIASNLVTDNKSYGIVVASANTKVYNNTLVNNASIGIWIYDDNRNANDLRGSDVGPDTANVNVVNNIMSGGSTTMVKASEGNRSSPLNTGPNTFMTTFDFNSYYRSAGITKNFVDWEDNGVTYFKTYASFEAAHPTLENHAQDFTSGTDPFFVDLAAGNYAIRPTSAAYHAATTLPDDVASALGLTVKTGYSRGAISWPGH
jgi:parallel beta-helix repeat protein